MTNDLAQFPEAMSELTSLCQEFLAVHSDSDGGNRLHALYADEAYVFQDKCLVRKCDTDQVSFAEAHRHAGTDENGRLTVFKGILPLAGHVERDNNLAVGWFEVRETRDERLVTLACGFRREEGQWRVGWCVVASSRANWSYQDGLLQTLADYQLMGSDQAVELGSSLDASYIRLYRPPTIPFHVLPETRFRCHMSGVCCKAEYGVVLPATAQKLIDVIPWDQIRPALQGTQLAVRSDGQLQLKDNHETCRFLDEQTQCLIHKTLGRQPFGPCAVFPFAFAETPDGMAVSTSLVCGSVRNRLGPLLSECQDTMRERLPLAKVRTPQGFRLAPGLEVSWEAFRDTEKVLLDLLDENHIPVYRRLYVGNRVLDALRKRQALTLSVWLEEPLGELKDDLRMQMHAYFARILGWDRLALQRLPQNMPLTLHHERLRDAPLVIDILKNLLFSKVYSYPYDLATAHNLAIVLYVLTLTLQSACDEHLPDELWQELAFLGSHGLLKSLIPDSAPPSLIEFLGSSEFGLWALWYPQP